MCTSQAQPAQVQVFGYSTKVQTRLGLGFVPSLAGAAQAARSLTSALSLGAVCLIPSAVWPQLLCALVGCALCLFWESDFWLQPSWWMSTIQNLRKSLVRSWKPVFSLLGDAVSGAKSLLLSPPPCLLPPAGDGPVCSWLALLWDCSVLPLFCELAGIVFGSQVNFFSLLLSHSLSCYHALAPSDCPQGIQAWSLP